MGQQAVIFKVWVRFERDRMERQRERDIATKRRRERADNKNPEQSWVAQLVKNRFEKNTLDLVLRSCEIRSNKK